MKRLLLLCFLAFASCVVTTAQTTSPTTQTDLKILFNSGVSQYEAGIQRTNQTLANAGFTSAMNVISTSISQLQQQMNAASSQANKAIIQAKITAQSQVQTDLLALQGNIMGNSVAITNKFTAFKALM
ncbi:hypothetical protein [Polluticoccus soli]|uniref:hypothetical protein n=1 Tax=Polluticoccus soli TaxID=3034150 RepID=UPI0023E343C6|nr:hypothetical protein [Flavipsychrobacter sp. JY13-12]